MVLLKFLFSLNPHPPDYSRLNHYAVYLVNHKLWTHKTCESFVARFGFGIYTAFFFIVLFSVCCFGFGLGFILSDSG